MPMSPRLLRPRAGGADHPEALAWAARVATNGGSVGSSTLAAVSAFCRAIDAGGIRDKFYRVNLICGAGLSAALVPLYRGRSRTGFQYGNTTDTNNGPFVSADYAATGSTGGLVGNGTSKYLNTGFDPNFIDPVIGRLASESDFHLSCYVSGTEATGTSRILMGNFTSETIIGHVAAGSVQRGNIGGTSTERTGPASFSQGMLGIATNGSRSQQFYLNGSATGTATTGTNTFQPDAPIFVFATNNAGTPGFYTLAPRIRAYSIGLGLSAAQMTTFYNAMQAFQTALGRQA